MYVFFNSYKRTFRQFKHELLHLVPFWEPISTGLDPDPLTQLAIRIRNTDCRPYFLPPHGQNENRAVISTLPPFTGLILFHLNKD